MAPPSVYLGNGNGTFTVVSNAFPPYVQITGLADFNGDGRLDAYGSATPMLGSSQTTAGIMLGNGNGTFGSYIPVLPPDGATISGDPIEIVQASDMNGDGLADLIVSDYLEYSPPNGSSAIFVDLNTPEPVASFSPGSVSFPQTVVGRNSSVPVTLTNNGALALTVTGVELGGANPGEFSQTNNCTTVQPLAACTINVTFTPTASGRRPQT